MAERIKSLKQKKEDGTYSNPIPLGADAENIDMADGRTAQEVYNKIEEMLTWKGVGQ